MAIIESSNQLRYTGRQPLDTKSLVQTYAKLTTLKTWQDNNGDIIAYNGMITAVWLDKDENSNLSANNGVYLLFDPNVTSTRGDASIPDVTKPEHWHKICELSELNAFAERLGAVEGAIEEINKTFIDIDTRLDALEVKSSAVTPYSYKSLFPKTGAINILYIALDEDKSYLWSASSNDYVEVMCKPEAPSVIDGGSASI